MYLSQISIYVSLPNRQEPVMTDTEYSLRNTHLRSSFSFDSHILVHFCSILQTDYSS